jgi:hypothetical protein
LALAAWERAGAFTGVSSQTGSARRKGCCNGAVGVVHVLCGYVPQTTRVHKTPA